MLTLQGQRPMRVLCPMTHLTFPEACKGCTLTISAALPAAKGRGWPPWAPAGPEDVLSAILSRATLLQRPVLPEGSCVLPAFPISAGRV